MNLAGKASIASGRSIPLLASVAGINLPKLGVCVALSRNHNGANAVPDATNVALAQSIGASIIRLDAFWASIEGSLGIYNWLSKDGLINAARNAGLTVIFILDYGNILYGMSSANSAPLTGSQITAFANFCAAAVSRYGTNNIIYEIWNEQNLAGTWNGAPNVSQYSALFSAAYGLMKAANPDCVIISGGLGTQGQGPPNDPNSYAAAFSAITISDGIADHPYNNNPENIIADCSSFVAANNKPFYITEFGYTVTNIPDKTQSQKANWLSRGILCGLASSAKTLIIYNLISDVTDPTNVGGNFGLYDFNYNMLPAANQFLTIANLCANCRLMERLRYPEGVQQNNFYQKDNSVSRIVWGEAAKDFNISLNVDTYFNISVTDLLGNAVSYTALNRKINFTIVNGSPPVMITTN